MHRRMYQVTFFQHSNLQSNHEECWKRHLGKRKQGRQWSREHIEVGFIPQTINDFIWKDTLPQLIIMIYLITLLTPSHPFIVNINIRLSFKQSQNDWIKWNMIWSERDAKIVFQSSLSECNSSPQPHHK
jgi:hypothetical protein